MRDLLIIFSLAAVSPLLASERTGMPNNLPFQEPGKTPEDKAMELKMKRCVPCEGKMKPLTQEEENEYAQAIPRWEIKRKEMHKIVRQFLFKNFKESINFVNTVAEIAQEENHHPAIEIFFNSVIIELYTHAISGLSENDFIIAARIDEVAHKQRSGARKK